jgi:methylthioribose-1-phosphate isomerase
MTNSQFPITNYQLHSENFRTIFWEGDTAVIIEQTKLPLTEEYLHIDDYRVMIDAIKRLAVRGAPAIGIAGVFASALAAKEFLKFPPADFCLTLRQAIKEINNARPTAVNLSWGLKRAEKAVETASVNGNEAVFQALKLLGQEILEEDIAMCRAIGEHGAKLLPEDCAVITHCNAGGLATGGYGTALGVIFSAHLAGKKIKVYVDETRPLLQGARLTAWELMRAGVDTTLICDNMAGFLMSRNKIDACIVGADRIAANGDTANKIGTYNLAISAKFHNVPFYVSAPYSTLDPDTPDGAGIPIEERGEKEIVEWGGIRTAPIGVKTWSPAFDVTPNELIAGIITEKGLFKPPYDFRNYV